MQRSIAAKYVARPAARFVRPVPRDRGPRLGLRSGLSFRPAPTKATVLRVSRLGLSVTGWQAALPAPVTSPRSGIIKHRVEMTWTGPGRTPSMRRSSPAPAPWRG